MSKRMCDFFTTVLVAGILYSGCLTPEAATTVYAQNTTCATRPAGDASNACASTQFVSTATSGNLSPVTYGVTCIGGDDTATIQNWLNAVVAAKASAIFPASYGGKTCHTTGLTVIAAQNFGIEAEGPSSVTIAASVCNVSTLAVLGQAYGAAPNSGGVGNFTIKNVKFTACGNNAIPLLINNALVWSLANVTTIGMLTIQGSSGNIDNHQGFGGPAIRIQNGQVYQTGSVTSGTKNITGLNTQTLLVGMSVTGPDIPGGTIISTCGAISTSGGFCDASGTVVLNNNATGTSASEALLFYSANITNSGPLDVHGGNFQNQGGGNIYGAVHIAGSELSVAFTGCGLGAFGPLVDATVLIDGQIGAGGDIGSVGFYNCHSESTFNTSNTGSTFKIGPNYPTGSVTISGGDWFGHGDGVNYQRDFAEIYAARSMSISDIIPSNLGSTGFSRSIIRLEAGYPAASSTYSFTNNQNLGSGTIYSDANGVLTGQTGDASNQDLSLGKGKAITFHGATSGGPTVSAQAVAGTPAIVWPTIAGTLASSASSPIVLDATTGIITCPTCATSSGGGAVTGTSPIAVSAGGVVSINAPYVSLTASNGGVVYSGATNLAILSGTATARQMFQSGASTIPAWSTTTWPATSTINRILYSSAANVIGEISTINGGILNANSSGVPVSTVTPVLGVPGTVTGTFGFAGITSGTATITPQSIAGSPTLTLPNASGTFAVSAATPLSLSATTGAITWTGTSGGIPYFSSTTTAASSALLTANAIVTGGGAGAAPSTLASLGTTTTVLHGNAGGAPTFSAVSLLTDTTGTLGVGSGGTGQTSSPGLLRRVTVFTSTGASTWTKGADVSTVVVEVIAGGGSGGGCAATSAGQFAVAGGGAGGGFSLRRVSAPGATETVTVGAGGVAPTAGNNNGNTGGTSSFGTWASATGGGPGLGAPTAVSGGVGTSTGGIGSSGDVNLQGGPGLGTIWSFTNAWALSGNGGMAARGGGGGTVGIVGGAGVAGGSYGGGGSGCSLNQSLSAASGGPGFQGVVNVYEYQFMTKFGWDGEQIACNDNTHDFCKAM